MMIIQNENRECVQNVGLDAKMNYMFEEAVKCGLSRI